MNGAVAYSFIHEEIKSQLNARKLRLKMILFENDYIIL